MPELSLQTHTTCTNVLLHKDIFNTLHCLLVVIDQAKLEKAGPSQSHALMQIQLKTALLVTNYFPGRGPMVTLSFIKKSMLLCLKIVFLSDVGSQSRYLKR